MGGGAGKMGEKIGMRGRMVKKGGGKNGKRGKRWGDFWGVFCEGFLEALLLLLFGGFLEGGRYKRGVLGGCGGGLLKRKTDVISGVC